MSVLRVIGGTPAAPKGDADVIAFLETALKRARRGDIKGVVLLAEDAEGVGYEVAGIQDRFRVSGFLFHALYQLQHNQPE